MTVSGFIRARGIFPKFLQKNLLIPPLPESLVARC